MPRKLTYDEVNELFLNAGYTLVDKEYINSSTKMKYICPKHPNENTEIRVSDLKNGIRCPFCSGVGRKNIESVKNEFSLRGYRLLEDEFVNNKTKMKYLCLKHPEEVQYIRYDGFQGGRGCKFCGKESAKEKIKLPFDVVESEFEKRGYVLLEKNYKNNRQKLRFVCPEHQDKENYITYSDLQKGVGCSYCSGTKKLTIEEVKSLFESHNYTLLEDEYVRNNSPMMCYCNEHKDSIQYITVNKIKNGYRCVYCAGKKATKENNLFVEYPELIKEWDFQKNSVVNPYETLPYSNKNVWWICELGHKWDTEISNRTNKGSGCPYCSQPKGEKRIRKWLEENNIKFMPQKEFEGLLGINNGNLSYDFYIPELNILIEYQGEFHDGGGSEFTKRNLSRQNEHDRRKRDYAQCHSIELLEVWYWDYDEIENILSEYFKII